MKEFLRTVDLVLEKADNQIPSHEQFYKHRELKKVRDEGYPISLFINLSKKEIEYIQPSFKDHEMYDAEIFLKDQACKYLECTYAKDGELEKYQGIYLDKYGHVPLTGVDTSNLWNSLENGEEFEGEAVDHSEYVHDLVDSISKRINKKLVKNYPRETILLVAFEDDFREETFNDICGLLEKKKVSHDTFEEIYIIGICIKRIKLIYERSKETPLLP